MSKSDYELHYLGRNSREWSDWGKKKNYEMNLSQKQSVGQRKMERGRSKTGEDKKRLLVSRGLREGRGGVKLGNVKISRKVGSKKREVGGGCQFADAPDGGREAVVEKKSLQLLKNRGKNLREKADEQKNRIKSQWVGGEFAAKWIDA